MDEVFIYVTQDGNGRDYRVGGVTASGVGEAAQFAYARAADNDRHCVLVAEASDRLVGLIESGLYELVEPTGTAGAHDEDTAGTPDHNVKV